MPKASPVASSSHEGEDCNVLTVTLVTDLNESFKYRDDVTFLVLLFFTVLRLHPFDTPLKV